MKTSKRRFRLAPIEYEETFEELRNKHAYLIEKPSFINTFPKIETPVKVPKQKKLRLIAAVEHKPKIEVLKNEDVGSQANFLVYPDKDLPDSKPEDDIPKYIYTTRLKKSTSHDILNSFNQTKTNAAKEHEKRKAERRLVDTIVADYLCNHHFGHILPIYEGSGAETCPCCTIRNRESVRNVLGLPQELDIDSHWRTHKGQIKTGIPNSNLTIENSFRLSDKKAQMKWATSNTFERPEILKETHTSRSLPDADVYKSLAELRPTLSEISPRYYPNRPPADVYTFDQAIYDAHEDDDRIALKRINSANQKYQMAMSNLRRFQRK